MTQNAAEFNIEESMGDLNSPLCDENIFSSFEEEMRIDPSNINDCCIKQPIILMKTVHAYEASMAEADALKDAITRAYAILDPQARQMLEAGGIKVTEARVDACIRSFEDYVSLQQKYHAAKANAGKWKALVEAARSRKDMLVQLACNYRAEGSSNISLGANQQLTDKVRAIMQNSSNNE